MVPAIELEGAIPFAVISGLTPVRAYVFAVAGNLILLLPAMLLWRKVFEFARAKTESKPGFLHWLFNKIKNHKSRYIQVTGLISLALYVALPIPYTGIYTASILSALFDLPLWKAFCAIVLGVLADGIAILALTVGIRSLF
jgi:uncharacterized membrane protein